MSSEFFKGVTKIPYEGPDSKNPLAFRYYDANRKVMGKKLVDHLRPAVAYWHAFASPGADMFGPGTFDRPWFDPAGDPVKMAELKMDAAFEFFVKLGVPFYCFHDRDIAPEGNTLAEPLGRSPVFPPMVVKMIAIGERSGALEALLEKISIFYDEQVEQAVKSLTSLIEPLMIGVMGVMVGTIVMAVFWPIMELQKALM